MEPGSEAEPVRKPHRIFDRPRQPHDWRWVVGGVGRTLIVLGLLMFAFVAYELWGTGIYTAQAQQQLDGDFHDLAIPATTTTTVPGVTTTTDPAAPPPIPVVAYPWPVPEVGDVFVQIKIPKIGVDYKVLEGVDQEELAKGPGHYPDTVLPGQLGNTAIAAHRTTHGAPFNEIDQLDPGDEIRLSYPQVGETSPTFVYRVTSTEIVKPSDYQVIFTVDPTKATLVLTSCNRGTTQRIVVHAELDLAASSALWAATPLPTPDPTDTLPGEDSVPDTVPVSSPASTPATPSTTPAVAPVVAAPDAFAGGWFDDGAAWPHIIGWGVLLVALTYGGYRLARRTRRIWLGTLVVFAPFVVALYFWFENISRQLPPGL